MKEDNMDVQEKKRKYPWLVSDEEMEAMWNRLENRKDEVRRRYINSIRNYAFRLLTLEGGFMDKRHFSSKVCSYIVKTYFAEHTDETWVQDRGSIRGEASWFSSGLAREVVRWLAENTCIDLYDVIATKKGMERLQKFGVRVQQVRAGKDDTVKVWPKQWNID